jgi:7,8-dihydropterin-6-yl-methyl-4-(beta-D-ribofuranosyl)aminobenzene 5'-phosphate synthase
MKITTLIENRPNQDEPSYISEWGLSLHIEFGNHFILFDTGASGAFAENAKRLNIDLESVNAAILSHHHFDHGGGIKRFFELNSMAKIYHGKAPDGDCYIKLIGPLKKYIGLNKTFMRDYHDRFLEISEITEILPNVFIFPHILRTHSVPSGNKKLYLIKEGNARLDEFTHEIVMAINEDEKLVIFTGCSHNGILNMVDSVSKTFKGVPIKALIGGFHLLSSPPFNFMAGTRQEVENISKAVLNYPIEMTFTGHCTGEKAYHVLKSVMGDRIKDIRTGSYFEI